MDERNIPLTDADLDKILPTAGYEVSLSHYFSCSLFSPNTLFSGFGLITLFYQFESLPLLCHHLTQPPSMEVLTTYLVECWAWWLLGLGNSGLCKHCFTLEQILPWCKLVTNSSLYSIISNMWAINPYTVDNQASWRLCDTEPIPSHLVNRYFSLRNCSSAKSRLFHTWCHQNKHWRFQSCSRCSSRQGCSPIYQAWGCQSLQCIARRSRRKPNVKWRN